VNQLYWHSSRGKVLLELFLNFALSSFVEARSGEGEREGESETLKGGVIHFLSPLHLIGIYSGSVLNGQSQREGAALDLREAFCLKPWL